MRSGDPDRQEPEGPESRWKERDHHDSSFFTKVPYGQTGCDEECLNSVVIIIIKSLSGLMQGTAPTPFSANGLLEMSHVAHIHHKDHSKQKSRADFRPSGLRRQMSKSASSRRSQGVNVHCALCGPGRQGPLVLCNNRQGGFVCSLLSLPAAPLPIYGLWERGMPMHFLARGAGFAESEYRGSNSPFSCVNRKMRDLVKLFYRPRGICQKLQAVN